MNHSASIATHARSPKQRPPLPETAEEPKITLTQREKEILRWSVLGKTSWEISRIVNCSESGVNYHFDNIRKKFKVSSRTTAAFKALKQGLIQLF